MCPKEGSQLNMYSVSKQLLKLAIQMCDEAALKSNFESSMLAIQTACQAEQYMLLEILGGSIDRIVINDEVRYADKYQRTKTAQMGNSPLVVTSDTDGQLVLFNSQNCEFVKA